LRPDRLFGDQNFQYGYIWEDLRMKIFGIFFGYLV
jgi:hypothetical protein